MKIIAEEYRDARAYRRRWIRQTGTHMHGTVLTPCMVEAVMPAPPETARHQTFRDRVIAKRREA